MDAIYRLTQPQTHFSFTGDHTLVIPSGMFAPTNAQASLFGNNGLWGLLLPSTVHGRVSDIWRGSASTRLKL